MMAFSDRLKKARVSKGLSQASLATALDVTTQAISQWETGKTEPNFARVNIVANILGVDVLWLSGADTVSYEVVDNTTVPLINIDESFYFSPHSLSKKPDFSKRERLRPSRKIVGQGFAIKIDLSNEGGIFNNEDIIIFDNGIEIKNDDLIIIFSTMINVEHRCFIGWMRAGQDAVSFEPISRNHAQFEVADYADISRAADVRRGMMVSAAVEHRRFRLSSVD